MKYIVILSLLFIVQNCLSQSTDSVVLDIDDLEANEILKMASQYDSTENNKITEREMRCEVCKIMLSLLRDQVDTEFAKLRKGPYVVGKEAYVMHTLPLACSNNSNHLANIEYSYGDTYEWCIDMLNDYDEIIENYLISDDITAEDMCYQKIGVCDKPKDEL